jgi:hypothetical protein
MGVAYIATPLLPVQNVLGSAFASFTTRQDISPQPLPVARAGSLQIGWKASIHAAGEYSSLTGAALTLGAYFGTAAAAITGFWETSVFTTGTTPAAWPWELDMTLFCTAIGTAGSLQGQGTCRLGTSLIALSVVPVPITAALRTVAIDTTIDRAFGVCATWGASSASNTIKTNQLNVQLPN